MALASLQDVNRILRFETGDDTERDAQLRGALDAIEDWAQSNLRYRFGVEGAQVESYYDIYENATLQLPHPGAIVTKVNIFRTVGPMGGWFDPIEMSENEGWEVTGNGRLILRASLYVEPFEGAVGERFLRRYGRVDVHYLADGTVPRGVTEGVAILAAGYWAEGPAILQQIKREKIGDYEYENFAADSAGGTGREAAYVTRSLFFLDRYLRRTSGVSVT